MLSAVGHCGGKPHSFATQVLGRRNDARPDWGSQVEEILESLSHALSDPDFAVRFAAASVLDDCDHLVEQTIPVFIEAMSQGTSFQKNWAALRLGRIGPAARAASEVLTKSAAGAVDQDDVWDKYAHLASRMALKRIGGVYKVGLPAVWLVGLLSALAATFLAYRAYSNDQGLGIAGLIDLPRWAATILYGVLAAIGMAIVLAVLVVTIDRMRSCPYCGTRLRAAGDQQCSECGADWSGHM